MGRAHGAEVPMIDRCDPGCSEPFGHRNHGRVGCTQWEICVGADQLSHSAEIG